MQIISKADHMPAGINIIWHQVALRYYQQVVIMFTRADVGYEMFLLLDMLRK